jgi:hypothetical protein
LLAFSGTDLDVTTLFGQKTHEPLERDLAEFPRRIFNGLGWVVESAARRQSLAEG